MFEFYQDFTKRGIEPRIEIPEEPIIIKANQVAMSRVIQNVVKNVLEHGNDKFVLRVLTSVDKVCIEFENEFSSKDEVDISKIFDRFYKADRARTSTSTGLGLAIARELVLKMNGEIKAKANETTFTIVIQFDIAEKAKN
jgi:signal transduction histidine kinase